MWKSETNVEELVGSLFSEDVALAVTEAGFACTQQALAEIEGFLSCDTDNSKTRFVEQFAERHEFEVSNAVMAFILLQRLIAGMLEHDLDADLLRSVSDDLSGLKDMEVEDRARFFSLMDGVCEAEQQLRRIHRRLQQTDGVLPMLKQAAFTVEGRLIRLSPLEGDYEQVPIASILLLLDSGDSRSVAFQATEPGVDDLIELLESVKEQISVLRNRIEPR